MRVYKGKVVSTNGRNIVVTTPILEKCDIEVEPMFDGGVKDRVPAVDEYVWIFDLTGAGKHRKYMPVESNFSSLTDTASDVQLEAPGGDVWIEGGTIYCGASADDWVAMAAKVITEFDRVKTELAALKVALETHTHEFPPGSGVLTDVDSTTFVSWTPASPGDVASSNTKAES